MYDLENVQSGRLSDEGEDEVMDIDNESDIFVDISKEKEHCIEHLVTNNVSKF